MLHRLALGSPAIAEVSFDMDQRAIQQAVEAPGDRHVFVSGLARAGTTILMRRLYATGEFCSLTYRNMPFVLAPNSLHFLRQGKGAGPSMRAHGDEILVDVDSPESLDEVFWRVFDGASYIGPASLAAHVPAGELLDKFGDYISAILHADPKKRRRYLSKNNNNLLRLGRLGAHFPKSTILVPFRAPEAHAGSLLRQHENFTASQKGDAFVQKYMTWLVHHEFGLDHRPFDLANVAGLDPFSSAYWTRLWCATYAWLEETAPPNAVFVCYEDLCRTPDVWRSVADLCGVSADIDGETLFSDVPDATGDPEAMAIYARLRARSRSALGI